MAGHDRAAPVISKGQFAAMAVLWVALFGGGFALGHSATSRSSTTSAPSVAQGTAITSSSTPSSTPTVPPAPTAARVPAPPPLKPNAQATVASAGPVAHASAVVPARQRAVIAISPARQVPQLQRTVVRRATSPGISTSTTTTSGGGSIGPTSSTTGTVTSGISSGGG